jgi:hypothetical protein
MKLFYHSDFGALDLAQERRRDSPTRISTTMSETRDEERESACGGISDIECSRAEFPGDKVVKKKERYCTKEQVVFVSNASRTTSLKAGTPMEMEMASEMQCRFVCDRSDRPSFRSWQKICLAWRES